MPYEEYVMWVSYLKEKPIGRSEDYRAAMIMSSFNNKIQIEKIFPSLRTHNSVSDMSGIKKSVAFSRMVNAVGAENAPEGFFDI